MDLNAVAGMKPKISMYPIHTFCSFAFYLIWSRSSAPTATFDQHTIKHINQNAGLTKHFEIEGAVKQKMFPKITPLL